MADVLESSTNPHAPEYIPIPTSQLPPPPRRRTYVLLPMHRFFPVMLPTYPYPPLALPPRQFLPVMLPTHPYPPLALPPRQFPPALQPLPPPPTVDSPPQENVHMRRLDIRTPKNGETTVLIRNIPHNYNREMLMDFLDEYCFLENLKDGEDIHIFAYDFLYLPWGFKKYRGNPGYAFVNFTDHRTMSKFFWAFTDESKVYPNSQRKVEIVIANIQGKDALVDRFKDGKFPYESEGCHPVWFNPPRNGTGEPVQVITMGTLIPVTPR